MVEEIRIFEFKRIDLKDAIIIDGFPSLGLVSSIVANYLINALNLEQVGIMDSVQFPTVSLIRKSEPHTPVRIYASTVSEREIKNKVVTFISEFQPPSQLIKPISRTLIDWAEEQRCRLIISPEGLIIEHERRRGHEPTVKPVKRPSEPVKVYGVGSTTSARNFIIERNVHVFSEGVITGVAAVLLNEGKRRDFDVVCLLAEARPDYPDARAAASIIEIISKIFLEIPIDIEPLYREAEKIESQIKTIHKQTTFGKPPKPSFAPSIYG
jgi:uncharacterized protein